jgi:hypothetical protein
MANRRMATAVPRNRPTPIPAGISSRYHGKFQSSPECAYRLSGIRQKIDTKAVAAIR